MEDNKIDKADLIAAHLTSEEIQQWDMSSDEEIIDIYIKNSEVFIVIDSYDTNRIDLDRGGVQYNKIGTLYTLFDNRKIYVELVKILQRPNIYEIRQAHVFKLLS